jgi:hypothetical protein
MAIDFEDMAMESNLFPWLDSDCMADQTTENYPGLGYGQVGDSDFFDECNEFEDEEDFE